jgi:hypothetical protein
MMNEKKRGREEDDENEEKQMQMEQQEGEMLDDDMNNEGRRRIKRKRMINDEDDNNKSGQNAIVRVPEDVMTHIVGYLHQKEVVSGLSKTNKIFAALMRDRYRIEIKMYPDEVLFGSPRAWKNIANITLVTTVWARNGVRYENFVDSIKKDVKGKFTLKEVRAQLDRHSHYHKVSFSQFDIQTLQMTPLKGLKLEKITISRPDLEIIQSMRTIESLIF